MLEGLLNMVKGLFVKPDGSIKWMTIAAVAGGAALGGFGIIPFLGGQGALGAVFGGLTGLAGGAVLSMIMPDNAPANTGNTGGQPGANGNQQNNQGQGQQQAMANPNNGLPNMGQGNNQRQNI